MNKAAQVYQTNSVTTAAPAELTMMLYNGALKFIKLTKQAIQEKKLDKASQYNARVQDILLELMASLNRDFPISVQFLTLYEYMYQRMVEANIKKEVEILDEMEDFFVQFRDTWREAMILTKNPTVETEKA